MPTRRDFLKTTAAGSGLLLTAMNPALAQAAERAAAHTAPHDDGTPPNKSVKALDLLILGGTGFIGPHLVKHAVARGHRVTIFTRGRRAADLPASVTHLVGDRDASLDALVGKKWDAVIDDSSNTAVRTTRTVTLLKDAVGAYLFTSSTGVYYPYLKRGLDESDPIRYDADDPKDGSASFGVEKANSEKVVLDTYGDRGVIVRPTYIVGPGDSSDRFPYWPVRLARGGEVLAPGKHDDPMQIIDVRDLAEFMVHLLEEKQHGVFNVAGPKEPLTAHAFYEAAKKALDANVTYTFVDDYEFLAEQKIDEAIPWAMLKGNDFGMMSVKNGKSMKAGLRFRPLDVTLRDTRDWWPTVPQARRDKPRFTITPDQEARALAAWHAKGH